MLQLLRNFFTALGNIFRKPRTVVYPREKIIIPEKSRGMLYLKLDLDSLDVVCNGCGDCQAACPESCLNIKNIRSEEGKQVLDIFQFDLGACIFCGRCVEACEFDAVGLSYRYQNADTERKNLVLDKGDLIRPSGTIRGFWK